MTIFETVKAAVPVRAAAEHYGLTVSPKGMACCPLHDDRHPSLKLNADYFYCFGCGAKGDVTEFTAKLFGITPMEAAQKLSADFGIPGKKPSVLAMLNRNKGRIYNEKLCFQVLRDYIRILQDWKLRYAPKTPGEEFHPHFVEACQMLDCMEYQLDTLRAASGEARLKLVDDLMKDDKVTLLAQHLREIREAEHGQA